MMMVRIIAIAGAILTLLLFKNTKGSMSGTHDQEALNGSVITSNTRNQPCCTTGYQSFHSIFEALENITSNDIITITADGGLHTTVTLIGAENVTILGQGNVTLDCKNLGALNFVSCNNVTIYGINWNRCGSNRYPYAAIRFYNSSNIALERCTFQHSVRKVVRLLEVSGYVYIKSCKFINNNPQHNSHGAALDYRSATKNTVQNMLIENCSFSENGVAKSVVYANSTNKSHSHLIIRNSAFSRNKEVPIYISHQHLHLQGFVLVERNTAANGGGVFSENSTIMFHEHSNISFIYNSARNRGGAISLSNSTICLMVNSRSRFEGNRAENSGGAMFAENMSQIVLGSTMNVFNAPYQSALHNKYCCDRFLNEDYCERFLDNSCRLMIKAYNVIEDRKDGCHANNSAVLADGNSTIKFIRNTAWYGGAIYLRQDSNILFGRNTSTMLRDNFAKVIGGCIYSNGHSSITFHDNSVVKFWHNKATNGGGAINSNFGCSTVFDGNTEVDFINNRATESDGGAIVSKTNSITIFGGNSVLTFKGNDAKSFGGALHYRNYSTVLFSDNSTVLFDGNQAGYGGGLCGRDYSDVLFIGFTKINFTNNGARKLGGAIYSYNQCNVLFASNSMTTFENNMAVKGGGIHSSVYSNISLDGKTKVKFYGNTARDKGGAIDSVEHCAVKFYGTSFAIFIRNRAANGGAVNSENFSDIMFGGYSTITFRGNDASSNGGALHSHTKCRVLSGENSTVTFINNRASSDGGALMSSNYSLVSFNSRSTVNCIQNTAKHGGALCATSYSNTLFDDNSMANFINNSVHAYGNGGAIKFVDNCILTFTKNATAKFVGNRAHNGGAVFISSNENIASQNGAAVHSLSNAHIMFSANCDVAFRSNKAHQHGGALYLFDNISMQVNGNAMIKFNSNKAIKYGGALYLNKQSLISFREWSVVRFFNNSAIWGGGALHLSVRSQLYSTGESEISFLRNKARSYGGAVHLRDETNIKFEGRIKVKFYYNKAKRSGGALYAIANSNTTFINDHVVEFVGNKVMQFGGAIHSESNSEISVKQNTIISFTRNIAEYGGAVSILQSSLLLSDNSSSSFSNNTAMKSGGAFYLASNSIVEFNNDSSITLDGNTADQFGGAMYGDLLQENKGKIIFNAKEINCSNNTALNGPFGYLDIPVSCKDDCLNYIIMRNRNDSFQCSQFWFNTPPSKLELSNPATCIDQDNGTNCKAYFIKGIMLGEEVITDACVRDHSGQRTGGTEFVVNGEGPDDYLNGSKSVLIFCDAFKGISLTGSKVLSGNNFSMTITSRDGSKSKLKTISTKLIVEISPCHPGFYYDNTEYRCVCYNVTDVVSCSGVASSIKIGHWFGEVDNQSTVSVCPVNYCNFTCCDTVNGFYQLSPVRLNQCSSHRSGTACGSCEEGYTLSFDSVECVSVEKCTTGQTVLVVTLSMLYWLVMVTLVFIMTYYHVGIGYLYAITYYYSMLDVLLSQSLHLSRFKTLFTIVGVMSSMAKVTPQFLGQFCLVQNMTGIDQVFLKYVHPLAVTIIVAIFCQLARISYKLSTFVSRGIIRVVCFLLLLSYTSVATTSLLLLRSLTFDNIDKVYTYLSPDIEYFHGRHLPYFIVAILCLLVIVFGLPLFLLLEPFLNRKINFIKFKPLLDHFQGCFRDKYRSFAAYYMICRLIIILIMLANPSNNNTARVSLIMASTILALIVIALKPYKSRTLNCFDCFILQLVTLLLIAPLLDAFDEKLLVAFTFTVIVLPLVVFTAMEVVINKKTLKNLILYCHAKPNTMESSTEASAVEISLVIDDNMRRNATICEIHLEVDDVIHFRESFMEVMDEIID